MRGPLPPGVSMALRRWGPQLHAEWRAATLEVGLRPLGVDVSPRLRLKAVEPPPERQGGIKVASVAELVDKLKNDAKVIA